MDDSDVRDDEDREEFVRLFREAAAHSDEFAEFLICFLGAAARAKSGDPDFDYGAFRAELAERSKALERRLHDDARKLFGVQQPGAEDERRRADPERASEGDDGGDQS